MLTIVTPSIGLVVSVAEVKDHLRIAADDSTQNAMLERLIRAVTAWLAGRDGWLGRALLTQEYELTLRGSEIFPRDFRGTHCVGALLPDLMTWYYSEEITLPRPPFQEVVSVTHFDPAGDATVIDPSDYSVDVRADGLARVVFRSDMSWPAAGRAAMSVRYLAGYGSAGADVDEGLRHAILVMIARLYGDSGEAGLKVDRFACDLFQPYRVWTRK